MAVGLLQVTCIRLRIARKRLTVFCGLHLWFCNEALLRQRTLVLFVVPREALRNLHRAFGSVRFWVFIYNAQTHSKLFASRAHTTGNDVQLDPAGKRIHLL